MVGRTMNDKSNWQCPAGCPHKTGRAWAVTRLASLGTAGVLSLCLLFFGNELSEQQWLAFFAGSAGLAGTGLDTKGLVAEVLKVVKK